MSSSASSDRTDRSATDVGVQRLARVYAQALLDSAEKAGCRAEVLGELGSLASDVLPKVPSATALLGSPRVPVEEKEALIEKICAGRVHPTTLHTLHVLARHDRLGILADIVAAAGRMADERDGLRRAEFITAVPIDPAEREHWPLGVAVRIGPQATANHQTVADPFAILVVDVEGGIRSTQGRG